MLNWLKEYVKNTPISVIQEEWREIEKAFPEGVNAKEYIKYSNALCDFNCSPPDISNTGFYTKSKKLTSNFSGSFFFVNIA